ncbi:MAG: hypothetical protein AAB364_00575 [Patescibacteria group bacterium]
MLDQFIVYAADVIPRPSSGNCGGSGPISNPINICSIQDFVNKLLEIVVQVGLPVLVVAIVYVGFLFVQARGAPDKLSDAKRALLGVVIGAAIILGAYIISSAIGQTINSLK